MSTHDGFTCAEVDSHAQDMALIILDLRKQVAAALRAYDTEVLDRRHEVTRLLAELRGERVKYRQVVETNHANQRSYWAETDALRAALDAAPALVEACNAIPDITISKWACDPGGPWNGVREALRARRAAQGLTVDAADPVTAFDELGWLKQREGTVWRNAR